MGHTHLKSDDPSIESLRGVFQKVRRALCTSAFGLNEIRMPPGFEGIEHNESDTGHEEVYVILDGGGTFTVDGKEVSVSAGDYLPRRPGVDEARVDVRRWEALPRHRGEAAARVRRSALSLIAVRLLFGLRSGARVGG